MRADSLIPVRRTTCRQWAGKHDFDRVAMTLALPAGWRLLHATGADRADGARLSQWNLLDFFLVLLIALAAGKLWGIRWWRRCWRRWFCPIRGRRARLRMAAVVAVAVLHRALIGRFKVWTGWF